LDRSFWLPTARTFSLTGSATISPLIPDDMIDRLVGRPGADGTGIVAYSIGRLPGDLRAGAIATLDDNASTIWEPGFGATHQAGDWLEYRLPAPVTFDHLDLQIVADGQHSVPTSLTGAGRRYSSQSPAGRAPPWPCLRWPTAGSPARWSTSRCPSRP
jgi:arabinofuranan 3-O-arabinosyltransferase